MKITGEWYKCVGATDEEINMLRECIKHKLPEEYLGLLKYTNGGEGPLNHQPYNLVLYSVSEILEYEKEELEIPGYFVFGGDGGNEYIALDLSDSSVVAIDACNASFEDSVLKISESMISFIGLIGTGCEEA